MNEAGQEVEPDVIFPDVILNVSPSQLDALPAGAPVTFVGIIRELQRGPAGERLLRLDLKELAAP